MPPEDSLCRTFPCLLTSPGHTPCLASWVKLQALKAPDLLTSALLLSLAQSFPLFSLFPLLWHLVSAVASFEKPSLTPRPWESP